MKDKDIFIHTKKEVNITPMNGVLFFFKLSLVYRFSFLRLLYIC